jgi:hypothetical protein
MFARRSRVKHEFGALVFLKILLLIPRLVRTAKEDGGHSTGHDPQFCEFDTFRLVTSRLVLWGQKWELTDPNRAAEALSLYPRS